MKQGIILAGGDLSPAFAERIIKQYGGDRVNTVIAAADGGLEILDTLGIRPDLILGDFDTVRYEVLARYEDQGEIRIIRHDPVKDASDLELTIDVLKEDGIRDVILIGALGGRADHTLANLRLLYFGGKQGMRIHILDEVNRIRCLVPENTEEAPSRFLSEQTSRKEKLLSFCIDRDKQWGKYVSIFPYAGTVSDLTLKGFAYPLTDHALHEYDTPSLTVSNEIREAVGEFLFRCEERAGLIVMETGDRS